jgi:hypothetical protein
MFVGGGADARMDKLGGNHNIFESQTLPRKQLLLKICCCQKWQRRAKGKGIRNEGRVFNRRLEFNLITCWLQNRLLALALQVFVFLVNCF